MHKYLDWLLCDKEGVLLWREAWRFQVTQIIDIPNLSGQEQLSYVKWWLNRGASKYL